MRLIINKSKHVSTQSSTTTTASTAGSNAMTQVKPKPSTGLSRTCSKCPKLKQMLGLQLNNQLTRHDWELAVRLLVDNGYIALAREFSRLSSKHDFNSENWIDSLLSRDYIYPVTCVSLGCTKFNVGKCCEQIKYNESKAIINSPNEHIRSKRDFNKT